MTGYPPCQVLVTTHGKATKRIQSKINNALNLKNKITYIKQNYQNYAIISLDQEKTFDSI